MLLVVSEADRPMAGVEETHGIAVASACAWFIEDYGSTVVASYLILIIILYFTVLTLRLVSTIYLTLVIITIIYLSPGELGLSSWWVVSTKTSMIGFSHSLLHR